MADLGVKLKPTRQIQVWIEPDKDRDQITIQKMPFTFFMVNEGLAIYGHAEIDGIGPKGIKIGGMGGYGKRVDPEADPDNPIEPTHQEVEKLCKDFEDCVPLSKGKVNHVTRCFFVQSPDGHFIVDRLTGYRRVSIGCGFSGHGFKF